MGFKVQVKREQYFKGYDTLNRFIGYYHQTNSVVNLKDIKSVLEVGIGNKTVYSYLKNFGYNVTSCDFDKSLKPDVINDVRNLSFKDNKFDAVVCFEVLEHLPLKDLPKALSELHRVSKKYVIISVPYYCAYFDFFMNFSIGRSKKSVNFRFKIPYFFVKPKLSGQHYWALGLKGISKRRFKEYAKKVGLVTLKSFSEKTNPQHHYFIMKKI